MGASFKDRKLHLVLLVSLVGVFIWSVITPFDFFTWISIDEPGVCPDMDSCDNPAHRGALYVFADAGF
jgi:hypothetical protein